MQVKIKYPDLDYTFNTVGLQASLDGPEKEIEIREALNILKTQLQQYMYLIY